MLFIYVIQLYAIIFFYMFTESSFILRWFFQVMNR